jgi:hypothetical protein
MPLIPVLLFLGAVALVVWLNKTSTSSIELPAGSADQTLRYPNIVGPKNITLLVSQPFTLSPAPALGTAVATFLSVVVDGIPVDPSTAMVSSTGSSIIVPLGRRSGSIVAQVAIPDALGLGSRATPTFTIFYGS